MLGPIVAAGKWIVQNYKPIASLGGIITGLIIGTAPERIEKAKEKAATIRADIEAEVRKAEAAAGIEKAKIEAEIEKRKIELAQLELKIKEAEAKAKK